MYVCLQAELSAGLYRGSWMRCACGRILISQSGRGLKGACLSVSSGWRPVNAWLVRCGNATHLIRGVERNTGHRGSRASPSDWRRSDRTPKPCSWIWCVILRCVCVLGGAGAICVWETAAVVIRRETAGFIRTCVSAFHRTQPDTLQPLYWGTHMHKIFTIVFPMQTHDEYLICHSAVCIFMCVCVCLALMESRGVSVWSTHHSSWTGSSWKAQDLYNRCTGQSTAGTHTHTSPVYPDV